MDEKETKDKIIDRLKEVYDPEININIYDLGLIYDIKVDKENKKVDITHTLTSAFCGYADFIIDDIKKAGDVEGIEEVKIITTFDPPFSMNRVSEETKLAFGWD
tara:strand:- start:156 stop:467 length:312 start_codon:yes stop_codon:yes gene_type:complete